MSKEVFALEELSPSVQAETIDRFREMFAESIDDETDADTIMNKCSDGEIIEMMNNAPYRLFFSDGTTAD
jgi:hypothetical protein